MGNFCNPLTTEIMKNILVPIDFNKNENELLEHALRYARAFNAKLWLLHVAAPEPEFIGFGVGPQYIRDTRATELRKEHRLMNDFTDIVKEEGLDCEGLLINGATIEMILEEAEKLDIGLIITGHHTHNFFYKTFFGSVSSGVIKKTDIPVLIIPL